MQSTQIECLTGNASNGFQEEVNLIEAGKWSILSTLRTQTQ